MNPYISGRPSIHIRTLFNKNVNKVGFFPFNQEKHHFFFSARYALRAGIKALGIGPKDEILLPSYNCGVEIDPILNLGADPVFYRITKNLLVDIDDLFEKMTGKVKAILVTHFLGFPQPIDKIKEICVKKNLYLIEDCAHALLSTPNGKPLGSYGDISIFSLLKTLPVPNGGLLVTNNGKINRTHSSKKPNSFATAFYAAELLKKKTAGNNNFLKEHALSILFNSVYYSLFSTRLVLAGFRKYFNPKGLYLVKPDSHLYVEGLCSWGTSGLSQRIINKTDLEQIKEARRRNFEYLLDYFIKNERGILPFKELPLGVCPLFFPIILESAEKRAKLYETLKNRGVTTHPWWDRFHPAVPWDEFPDAAHLKTKLFGLPIHQDLTQKHLDHVIEEFERAYRRV